MARKRKEYGPSEGERMMRELTEAARQIAAEANAPRLAQQLELFKKLTICQYCQQPIHRVSFCGSTIWEHVISADARHGPHPRTLCRTGSSDAHATPYFEDLITRFDVAFLRRLRVQP
jgi:hypothetical protein